MPKARYGRLYGEVNRDSSSERNQKPYHCTDGGSLLRRDRNRRKSRFASQWKIYPLAGVHHFHGRSYFRRIRSGRKPLKPMLLHGLRGFFTLFLFTGLWRFRITFLFSAFFRRPGEAFRLPALRPAKSRTRAIFPVANQISRPAAFNASMTIGRFFGKKYCNSARAASPFPSGCAGQTPVPWCTGQARYKTYRWTLSRCWIKILHLFRPEAVPLNKLRNLHRMRQRASRMGRHQIRYKILLLPAALVSSKNRF